jgi:hypothetical protein
MPKRISGAPPENRRAPPPSTIVGTFHTFRHYISFRTMSCTSVFA